MRLAQVICIEQRRGGLCGSASPSGDGHQAQATTNMGVASQISVQEQPVTAGGSPRQVHVIEIYGTNNIWFRSGN